jgi:hypothetical protein
VGTDLVVGEVERDRTEVGAAGEVSDGGVEHAASVPMGATRRAGRDRGEMGGCNSSMCSVRSSSPARSTR